MAQFGLHITYKTQKTPWCAYFISLLVDNSSDSCCWRLLKHYAAIAMWAMVPSHSPPVGSAQCCVWKMAQASGWLPVRSVSDVYRSLFEKVFFLLLHWLLFALSSVLQSLSQLCSCSCCSAPAVLSCLLLRYLSLQSLSEHRRPAQPAQPGTDTHEKWLETKYYRKHSDPLTSSSSLVGKSKQDASDQLFNEPLCIF